MGTESKVAGGIGGCFVLTIALNCILGGWSVRYLVEAIAHKVIPWGWAILIGLFAGELTIPGAIIVWILKHLGVL